MPMRFLRTAWFLGFALATPAVAQDTAETWHDKARALAQGAMYREAEQAYLETLKRYEDDSTGKAMTSLARCRCDYAEMLARLERFTAAEKVFRGLLQYSTRLEESERVALQARAHAGLGALYATMERSALAVAEYDEAVRRLQKLAEAFPANRGQLATMLGLRAQEQAHVARHDDAERSYRESIQTWHRLIVEEPKSPEYREQLAQACHRYGLLMRDAGRFLLARDLMRSAVETIETLHEALPREPKYWYHLPTFHRQLALPLEYLHCQVEKSAALRRAEQCEKRLLQAGGGARTWLEEARKLAGSPAASEGDFKELQERVRKAEACCKAAPEVPLYRSQLVSARLALATHAASSRWYDDARTAYREALAENAAMIQAPEAAPKYRRLQASTQIKLGLVHYYQGDDKEGARLIDEAIAHYRKLAEDYPDEPRLRRQVDEESANLMMFYLSRNADSKVIDTMRATAASLGKLCEKHPRCPEFRRHHAQAPVPLGHIFMRLKRDAEAEQSFRESLRLWSKVIEDFPQVAEYHLFQGQVRSHLLQLYHRQERWADAAPLVNEMQQAQRKLIAAIPLLEHRHTGLAVSHVWLATLAAKTKKTAEAVEQYGHAITLCEKAIAAQPGEREHLHLLIATLRERSALHQEAGNFAGYDRDLQHGKIWGEWLDSPFVRLTRIAHRLGSDQAEWARRDADDLFASGEMTAAQWFELAAIYARLLGAGDATMREAHASRSIVSLRRALEQGYRPTTPLAEDGQFRLLTASPEFQQLAAARP